MLELILLLCSVNTCEQVHIPLPDATMMQCFISAQSEAAKVLDTKPGFAVRQLSCGPRREDI